MKNIELIELTQNHALNESLIGPLESMFVSMYEHMSNHGLNVPLVPGGEKLWVQSVLPVLGRFGVVLLALSNGQAVGFAQGMIKILPNYLGGGKVGLISHIYVDPESRQGGIGSMLVSGLEMWFISKGIKRVELQVLGKNELGKLFWIKEGYHSELLQMHKTLTGGSNAKV